MGVQQVNTPYIAPSFRQLLARQLQGLSASVRRDTRSGMVRIPGGRFRMGTNDPDAFPADGEGPVRTVVVDNFLIDSRCVTNDNFAKFVAQTGQSPRPSGSGGRSSSTVW